MAGEEALSSSNLKRNESRTVVGHEENSKVCISLYFLDFLSNRRVASFLAMICTLNLGVVCSFSFSF